MELSVEEKWKRSRAALSMLLGSSIKAISESYGKEGFEETDGDCGKARKEPGNCSSDH